MASDDQRDHGQAPPPAVPETAEVARRRRLEALRRLSAGTGGQREAPASPTGHQTGTRRQWRAPWRNLILVLVAALVVLGAALRLAPWRHPPQLSPPITIILSDDHLICPSQVAWAPDATQIAVLGQSGTNCDTFSAVVALFDARGRFERTLLLDRLVLGANSQPTPAPGPGRTIQYFALSWSPDGHEIAIPYQITRTLPNQAIPRIEAGIALLNADGSSGRVLRQAIIGETSVWDRQTLRQVSQIPYTPPPALAFTWSSTGEVTPTSSSDRLGPVGNPSGDARFTIWQSGSIAEEYHAGNLSFQTMVAAWSPGGQYLTSSLLLGYSLSPSGPDLQPTANGGGLSTVRYRDAAMRAVALGLKGLRNTNIPSVPLAWRPDGRQLAALVFNQTSFDGPVGLPPTTAELLAIYDCASGNVLARLPTANLRMAPNSNTSAMLLRWSPDGRQVLLIDGAYAILTIWGPQQLP